MDFLSVKSAFRLLFIGLAVFICTDGWAEDWVFYAGSLQGEVSESAIREWYGLNRFHPVSEAKANILHYYDHDSVASNSPFPGGIVRVWEKAVFKKETVSYEEARTEIEKEKEASLKRRLSVLDYAWLFPAAVNRATKEITTLYDFNCDTREFFILELNTYDHTGKRMTREVMGDKYFWSPLRSGTILEILFRKVCE